MLEILALYLTIGCEDNMKTCIERALEINVILSREEQNCRFKHIGPTLSSKTNLTLTFSCHSIPSEEDLKTLQEYMANFE